MRVFVLQVGGWGVRGDRGQGLEGAGLGRGRGRGAAKTCASPTLVFRSRFHGVQARASCWRVGAGSGPSKPLAEQQVTFLLETWAGNLSLGCPAFSAFLVSHSLFSDACVTFFWSLEGEPDIAQEGKQAGEAASRAPLGKTSGLHRRKRRQACNFLPGQKSFLCCPRTVLWWGAGAVSSHGMGRKPTGQLCLA